VWGGAGLTELVLSLEIKALEFLEEKCCKHLQQAYLKEGIVSGPSTTTSTSFPRYKRFLSCVFTWLCSGWTPPYNVKSVGPKKHIHSEHMSLHSSIMLGVFGTPEFPKKLIPNLLLGWLFLFWRSGLLRSDCFHGVHISRSTWGMAKERLFVKGLAGRLCGLERPHTCTVPHRRDSVSREPGLLFRQLLLRFTLRPGIVPGIYTHAGLSGPHEGAFVLEAETYVTACCLDLELVRLSWRICGPPLALLPWLWKCQSKPGLFSLPVQVQMLPPPRAPQFCFFLRGPQLHYPTRYSLVTCGFRALDMWLVWQAIYLFIPFIYFNWLRFKNWSTIFKMLRYIWAGCTSVVEQGGFSGPGPGFNHQHTHPEMLTPHCRHNILDIVD
jgi:hypothetical protein